MIKQVKQWLEEVKAASDRPEWFVHDLAWSAIGMLMTLWGVVRFASTGEWYDALVCVIVWLIAAFDFDRVATAMERAPAIKAMWYERCEYDDYCDVCDKATGPAWALMSYGWETECDHIACGDCVLRMYREQEAEGRELMMKKNEGHTEHCACRLVYGDGECECGKEGKNLWPNTVFNPPAFNIAEIQIDRGTEDRTALTVVNLVAGVEV